MLHAQAQTDAHLRCAYKAEKEAAPAVKTYRAAALPILSVTPDEYLLPARTRQIQEAVLKMLEAEAPVSEGLLLRRVHQSFGLTRAGTRIQGRTEEVLRRMQLRATTQGDQKVYWAESQNPYTFTDFRATGEGDDRREAKDLPVQETAGAALAVLREQIGLPREDLVRETAKLLGYGRSGAAVASAISDGIDYALEQELICETQAGYLSPKA